jgi:GntR family transcriptional regulator
MSNFYERVARDLVQAISAGRYPVGSNLPTEVELCEQFGASRNTVRAALRELQDLGLISRRKKAGTRVESTQPTTGYRHSFDSVDELIQFGARHRREVKEVVETAADRALAKKLRCPVGKLWLRISSLRLDADDVAVGWTDVYVDPAYSDIADVVRAEPETLISTIIESRYGRRIAAIRQEIRGKLISPALASALSSKSGSAGLEVVRFYDDTAGETIEISVSVHPADRFTVVTRLTREIR